MLKLILVYTIHFSGVAKNSAPEKASHGSPSTNNSKRTQSKTIYDLMAHMSGRLVPGIPINQALPADPTERVLQLHWQHSTLLTFLRYEWKYLFLLNYSKDLLSWNDNDWHAKTRILTKFEDPVGFPCGLLLDFLNIVRSKKFKKLKKCQCSLRFLLLSLQHLIEFVEKLQEKIANFC